MSELDRHLQGVTPLDSPPDIPELEPTVDDESVTDDPDLAPDPAKQKGDRPVENLKGEMDRKLAAYAQQIQDLKELVLSLRQQPVAPVAPTQEPAQTDISRMSSAQLKQLRGTITDPAQRELLNDLIAQRTAEEVSVQHVQQLGISQQAASARDQANSMAVRRYPELLDPSSEFRRNVDNHLLELKQRYGESYLSSDPRIVLNAANEVAMKTGYRARDTRGGGNSVATRHQSAPAGGDQKPTADEERQQERIAQRLSPALPTGKSFDKTKLRKNTAVYKTLMDQIVKGQ